MFVFQVQMRIEVDNKADAEKLTNDIKAAAEIYGTGHMNSSFTDSVIPDTNLIQIKKKE